MVVGFSRTGDGHNHRQRATFRFPNDKKVEVEALPSTVHGEPREDAVHVERVGALATPADSHRRGILPCAYKLIISYSKTLGD